MLAVLLFVLVGLSCKTLQSPTAQSPSASSQPTTVVPAPTSAPTIMAPISSNQPFLITGSFRSTSEIGGKYTDNLLFSERQVLLIDMHGFITRNKKWEIPVISQVIGHVTYNPQDASGTYTLLLPEIPQGSLNDVDNNGQQSIGVQVFATDYEPNMVGDAFMAENDSLKGWPGNMASIKTSNDEENEVTGGKLIAYAPDSMQKFPSGFGADKKLFTADDPVADLPAGYSIIDLDSSPFIFSQPAQADLPLFEAADAGPKDYSKESYTQAFDNLLKFLRTDYAFSGIPGKQPDWDALTSQIRPRIVQAEKDSNNYAFYTALRDFTYVFKDGHAGLDGADFSTQDFQTNYGGGLGFTVLVLDNNQVLVNYIQAGSSAQTAGLKVGAILTQFGGKPVMDSIKSQPLFFGNRSSDVSILAGQAITLTRTKPGAQVSVSFINPGAQEQTKTLSAAPEVDSLLKELGYNKSATLLPVELQTLTSNNTDIGYIKLNSNMDDLNLTQRLFERGLSKFLELKVAGIIIDLRNNSGGVPLGLAGYFANQDIPLGQIEYYDSATTQFKPSGEQGKFKTKNPHYSFGKIAVLVGLDCASACELEAYAFSQLPGAVVVGQYPSGGIEAEVSKGQFIMPEGINMQFPTGRIVNLDGSLFLEGIGVQPTIKVPINAENALSGEDVILKTAEEAITGP